jgi:hypothetical protein
MVSDSTGRAAGGAFDLDDAREGEAANLEGIK